MALSTNIKSIYLFKFVLQEEDLAKELNFFSISSDGQVASWIMSKNEVS